MAKQRNTKVGICVSFKIKDLAQQIYDLDSDDVLCLFQEVDALYMASEDGFDWNEGLQEWIIRRWQPSDRRRRQRGHPLPNIDPDFLQDLG